MVVNDGKSKDKLNWRTRAAYELAAISINVTSPGVVTGALSDRAVQINIDG